MKFIDDFLNGITMYRLLLYGLLIVAATAIILGFLGILQISGLHLALSALLFTGVCWASNWALAKFFGTTANIESALITGLILFCLFLPAQNLKQAALLAMVGVIAMASKYVIVWRKRHIFNPAAFAAVVAGLLSISYAGWWVATDVMLPVALVGGFLILRKIKRFTMFFAFLGMGLLITTLISRNDDSNPIGLLVNSFTNWPLIFMGAVMLTEPLTTPPTRRLQVIYGALVGALIGLPLHVGPVYMTPELALVIGNIFSFATSLRKRVMLTLARKQELAPGIFSFMFTPDSPLKHTPGQYAELTLPLKHADSRGNRRFFTIASSPTGKEVAFGIKMNSPPSAFKKRLAELEPGQQLSTNHVAGDFTLPTNPKTKVIFIAGGIGVTPFHSMLTYLIDTKQSRDIVLFYQVTAQEQIVYRDTFKAAEPLGLKTIFIVSDKPPVELANPEYEYGFITKDLLAKHAPDYKERVAYVSGPPAMVKNYAKLLRSLGTKVTTDYFPGY